MMIDFHEASAQEEELFAEEMRKITETLPPITITLSGHFQPCPCQECARVFLEEEYMESSAHSN